ncbi:ribosomal protein L7/L12 [Mesorhizobium sp. B2-2-4]|nr:ribosomal protein L7/L12 [Mesorhizobium sp. B2-2-4]TPM67852.1 ribosomal protein L7/L12 [Mesorhizobium sp. B2-2-1]
MFYHDEPAPTTIADIVARHSQTGTAIVCVLENGQPAPATRPYVHTTASAAETEANRLARTNPGKEFGVYTLGTVAKVEKVYDHEWQRLAAGGQKINAIRELRGITGLGLATAKDAVEDWLRREAA